MSALEFRAEEPSDSNAIVVSFHSKWLEPLIAARLTAVVRRRYPTSRQPIWLYAYVTSPVAELVCRARISKIESVDFATTLKRSVQLLLSEDDIRDYIAQYGSIGLYTLEQMRPLKPGLSLKRLRAAGRFSPPQSFFYLSSAGKAYIDRTSGLDAE